MLRSQVVEKTSRGTVRRLAFILPLGTILGGIENAEDEDLIPTGNYNVFMIRMRGSKLPALWVPSDVVGVKQSHLCVHAANYADQLRGCAAPGDARANGVLHSGLAMQQIFDAFRGFRENAQIPFACRVLTPQENVDLRAMQGHGWSERELRLYAGTLDG